MRDALRVSKDARTVRDTRIEMCSRTCAES